MLEEMSSRSVFFKLTRMPKLLSMLPELSKKLTSAQNRLGAGFLGVNPPGTKRRKVPSFLLLI